MSATDLTTSRRASINDGAKIVAIVPDLFFAAKISGTARQVGARLEFANSEQDLLAKGRDAASLIILDLNASGFDPVSLIGRLKADADIRETPLVGFVRHEMSELIEAARAAGCDQVLTRNAFSKNLPELLRRD